MKSDSNKYRKSCISCGDTITLWTFQPLDAIRSAWSSGVPYRCVPALATYGGLAKLPESLNACYQNAENELTTFKQCYRWIAGKMSESGCGKPSWVDEGSYPIWAWAKWTDNDGIGHSKPDLRYMAFRSEKNISGNAMIELSINRHNALLSNFDLWHLPLNGIAIDDDYDVDGTDATKSDIISTWDSCLVPSDMPFDNMPSWTQACIWEISENCVKSITSLN